MSIAKKLHGDAFSGSSQALFITSSNFFTVVPLFMNCDITSSSIGITQKCRLDPTGKYGYIPIPLWYTRSFGTAPFP